MLKLLLAFTVAWMGLGMPVLARTPRCHLPLESWAANLIDQLPLFWHLVQSRAGLRGYTLLVSQGETRPFTPAELAAYGIPDTPDSLAWLYITTLEHRLILPNPDRRSFFFRLILARRGEGDPWQLVRTEMLTLDGQRQDVSDGLVAQGIRLWQQQGCPSGSDYRLQP